MANTVWVVFYVFGRLGYVFLAINALTSIRARGLDCKIKLCVQDVLMNKLSEAVLALFDKVEVISNEHLFSDFRHGIDSCYAKLNFWRYGEPRGVNIFLDADTLATGSAPLSDFISAAEKYGVAFRAPISRGTQDARMEWGEPVYAYKNFFKVEPYKKYITAVSSYIMAWDYYFTMEGLVETYKEFRRQGRYYANWQNNVPDELILQIYLNRIGYDGEGVEGVCYPIGHGEGVFTTYYGEMRRPDIVRWDNWLTDNSRITGIPVGTYYMKKGLFGVNESLFLNRIKLFDEVYNRNNKNWALG